MTVRDLNPHLRPVTKEQAENLTELARRITLLEELMERTFTVNSGFRTYMDQMRINVRCPKSAHTEGKAVDLDDKDGSIYDFLINNPDMLIKLDFYVEQKTFTPKWIHLQTRPTSVRFFKPF